MASISINLPHITAEDTVEVTVLVNGTRRQYDYRIEILPWDTCEDKDGNRVQCIRKAVMNHEKGWEVLQIGPADEHTVQITYQRVGDPVLA